MTVILDISCFGLSVRSFINERPYWWERSLSLEKQIKYAKMTKLIRSHEFQHNNKNDDLIGFGLHQRSTSPPHTCQYRHFLPCNLGHRPNCMLDPLNPYLSVYKACTCWLGFFFKKTKQKINKLIGFDE